MCVRRQPTALRYPEFELVSVPAHMKYSEPAKPLTWRSKKREDKRTVECAKSEKDI